MLNIGPVAAHNLNIDNEWVSFSARFGGVSHDIWIPVGHVISLFARETGDGMGFDVEPLTENSEHPTAGEDNTVSESQPSVSESLPADDSNKSGAKKGLKIVK